MSEAATNEPIQVLRTPVDLEYLYSAGQSASRILRGIEQGKILGQKCPVDGRVYFPSRGSCPQHSVAFGDETVELPDKGTVVTCDPPRARVSSSCPGSYSLWARSFSSLGENRR